MYYGVCGLAWQIIGFNHSGPWPSGLLAPADGKKTVLLFLFCSLQSTYINESLFFGDMHIIFFNSFDYISTRYICYYVCEVNTFINKYSYNEIQNSDVNIFWGKNSHYFIVFRNIQILGIKILWGKNINQFITIYNSGGVLVCGVVKDAIKNTQTYMQMNLYSVKRVNLEIHNQKFRFFI